MQTQTSKGESLEMTLENSIAELARLHLSDFILQTKLNYYTKWFHLDLCAYLDQVIDGTIKKIMIFWPPQHGKSQVVSRHFPAYLFGKIPTAQYVGCSYSADLAEEFNRDTQRIIKGEAYQTIFPGLTIGGRGVANNSKFEILKDGKFTGGVYRCAGVCGPISGKPLDFGSIDDPIKSVLEAQSQTYRDRLWEWWIGELSARLHNQSRLIFTCTRWHEDDLAGRILAREDGWKIFVLPGIKEDDRIYDKLYPPEMRLPTSDSRAIGEALWPKKHSAEKFAITKKNSERLFASMIQQRPAPTAGNMIKREWIKFFNPDTQQLRFEKIIQSWDCAFEGNASSDYVACTVWGKSGANLCLLYMTRGKWNFGETIANIRRVSTMFPGSEKLIERKANGSAAINTLQREIPGIIPIDVSDTKEKRVYAASFIFESGNVYFPINRKWTEETIEELITFPNGRHDDIVDTCTQAINRLYNKQQGQMLMVAI